MDANEESLGSATSSQHQCHREGVNPRRDRFEGKGAIRTILSGGISPLMFNVSIALNEAMELFLISRAFEPSAVAVVGLGAMLRYFCLCFAIYFSEACTRRVRTLIEENQVERATGVLVDFYRIGVLIMILVGIVFYFSSQPIVLLLGCPEFLAVQVKDFLTPILVAMPVIVLLHLSCAFLQSEGRFILSAVIQITSCVLNCGVILPILLFQIKAPLMWSGLGFALSQSLTGIITTICLFLGAFTLKPHCSDCFARISRSALDGLSASLPFFVFLVSMAAPQAFLISYIFRAADIAGNPAEVAIAIPVNINVNALVTSVSIGICHGFLFSAGSAYGLQKRKRFLELFGALCLVTFIFHAILFPIFVWKTEWPCSIWIEDANDLELAAKMIRVPFFTTLLIPLNIAMRHLLITMKKGRISLGLNVARAILFVAYTLIFYTVLEKSPIMMMYVYTADDVTTFILSGCCVIPELIDVYHASVDASEFDSPNVSLLYTVESH
jgi:Na+-driven multidrug efflux pump